MMRRWLFFIVIILFLGSLGTGYLYLRNIKRVINPALNAVPQNAALVIESDNFSSNWLKQSTTSLIFKELKGFETFARYDSIFSTFDSTLKKNKEFSLFLKKQPIYFSIIRSGAKDFDLLYNFNLPPEINPEDFIQKITSSYFAQAKQSSKVFDNTNIITLKTEDFSLHYALHKDIFSVSTNMLLIEDAVKQLNLETNLLNNKSFKLVYNTKGSGNDGNIYLNTGEFLSLFAEVIHPQNKIFTNPKNFAEWGTFDIFLKPNSLMVNGFFNAGDSTSMFLNRFKNQKATELEIVKYLPSNTCFLFGCGVSSFKDYQKQYLLELQAENQQFNYDKNIQNITNSFSKNVSDAFFNYTENEFGVFIVEPILSSAKNNTGAYFKSSNPDGFSEALNFFATKVDSTINEEEKSIIRKIDYPNLLESLFGSPFNLVTENYYTIYESYVLMANSPIVLKELILKHQKGKTLSKDVNYNNFDDNLGNEANVYYYLNLARSPKVLEEFLSSKSSDFYLNNKEFFRQFEAVSFQILKSREDLYYANLFLNHNPGYKQETGSLWELKLDTTISSQPFSFTNHYTNAKEIFVQDLNNKVYLISNTGKILWKRELGEKINGSIFMVDIYKNKKYQLLFATKSKVYLLDRNGKDVEKYPLKLESEITSGFTLLDYDNDKDYRILVPTKNGNLFNYNILGEKVKGWEYKLDKDFITEQIQFFQQNRKDYVVTISTNGRIKALNRKGEERLTISETLPSIGISNASLLIGDKLANTFLAKPDSLGNITKVYFNNKKEVNTQTQMDPTQNLSYAFANLSDKNSNAHFYITAQNGELNIFDQKFEFSVELNTEAKKLLNPQVFTDSKARVIIGLVAPIEKRVFLINQYGNLIENYPFSGSTQVCVDDFNLDGNLNLVVGNNQGKLLMYSFK